MELLNLAKQTGEQKGQRHVAQSAFAKIRYNKDKVASWEFCNYRG